MLIARLHAQATFLVRFGSFQNELAEGREERKCWTRFKEVMKNANEVLSGWVKFQGCGWVVKSGMKVGNRMGLEGECLCPLLNF
ncbi:hypothetical protein IH922_04745 [candidate division KSB1 bacterium]|nr:hypothetical protein [candidate division KSB1 bacterium]